MSEQNVQKVRDWVEALNRWDLDLAFDALHPEVEWQTLDAFPDAGTHRGPEGVREFFEAWRDTFRGFRVHLEKCVPVGDHQVLAAVHVSGEGAGSGAGVESPTFFQLLEVRDGRLVWARMFQTEIDAVEAARVRQ